LFGGLRFSDCLVVAGLFWAVLVLAAAQRSRRAAARWLLATFAAGLAWGAAEVGWRVMPRPEPKPWLGAFPTPNHEDRGETMPDIAHVWGVPGQPLSYHYVTNAWGYRNPPDLGNPDVICLGDSMLLAIHHPRERTIPGLLQSALGRPVGNVSLIDKSPQDMQRRFQALDLDLRGKVVVQFVCEENDLQDSYYYERDGMRDAPILMAAQKPLESLTNTAVLALQRWTQPQPAEAARRWGTFAGQPHWFLYRWVDDPKFVAQTEVIGSALTAFAAFVRERGGEFGVVLLPAKLRVLGPFTEFAPGNDLEPIAEHVGPLPTFLAAWSERAGVPYLDGSAALTALVRSGTSPWFANETHFSERGLAAVAEAVLAWPWFAERSKR
jgi:hypothetical protein